MLVGVLPRWSIMSNKKDRSDWLWNAEQVHNLLEMCITYIYISTYLVSHHFMLIDLSAWMRWISRLSWHRTQLMDMSAGSKTTPWLRGQLQMNTMMLRPTSISMVGVIPFTLQLALLGRAWKTPSSGRWVKTSHISFCLILHWRLFSSDEP